MRQVVSLLAVGISTLLVPRSSGATWEVASADHVVGVIPLEKKDMIAIVGGGCHDACYDCEPLLHGTYIGGVEGHNWECEWYQPNCRTGGTTKCEKCVFDDDECTVRIGSCSRVEGAAWCSESSCLPP